MADTLLSAVTFQQEIKKSRFAVVAIPLPATANPYATLRQLFADDATHNCWAYRIGDKMACDDGNEPAGTAGRPILAVIDAMHFDQTAVVVARWFGGIKLGAAGLMRAYRQTTATCLQSATRQPIIRKSKIRLHCRFHEIGTVYALLNTFGVHVDTLHYDANGVHFLAEVISDRLAVFKNHLIDATANHVTLTEENPHAGP